MAKKKLQEETKPAAAPAGHETRMIHVNGMYQNWFLDYASYVILERAVPHINDGLKPVQRRLMHSMWEMEDGRYNKVANIIGHCMKYHPHGDAPSATPWYRSDRKTSSSIPRVTGEYLHRR